MRYAIPVVALLGVVLVREVTWADSPASPSPGTLATAPHGMGTREPIVAPGAVLEPAPLPPPGSMPDAALSLSELEQLALANNPTLNQNAARVEAAQGQRLQVGLYPNPVVGYMGSEIGNSGRAGQQGGFVSQEVVTAGKLQLNRAVASQEVEMAQWGWQAQRQRVLTDLRLNFYEVLVAQRAVELAKQLVRIGEESISSSESLMKAKEVARSDVLQSRIEAESANIFLEKARNRYLSAWRRLVTVIGVAELQPRPLVGDVQDGIPVLTWDDVYNRLLAQSPELARAQSGVARARAALSRECAGRVPNIDLQAAVQYDNSTSSTFASIQAGIPVAIYNHNQGNIRKAQAELIAAQEESQRIRLALHQRLATVFEQYANACYQADRYKHHILAAAETSLELTRTGYQLGECNYLALLTAQRTYFQTNLAYLAALRDLHAAAAVIEGNLLADSLQAGEADASRWQSW